MNTPLVFPSGTTISCPSIHNLNVNMYWSILSLHLCFAPLPPSLPQNSCSSLNDYLRGPFGRYLLNVSTAAELCSQQLCTSHGRCLRTLADTDAYLHLNPLTHSISIQGGRLKVTGQLDQGELARYRQHFQCQCYSGYKGEGCAQRELGKSAAAPVWGVWSVLTLLLPLGLLTLLH